ELLERLRTVPLLEAPNHQRAIGRHPEEPRREAGVAAEGREPAVHPDERVLERVLRQARVSRQAPCERIDPGLVAGHERLERVRVAGGGPAGEHLVARPQRLRIASLTFAATSGGISVRPWLSRACAPTFSSSSASVCALASKLQPGTTAPHAMCFS